MNHKLFASIALLAVVALLLGGCGDDATETPETPDTGDQEETVRTMDEYRSEAAEQITEENAEDELRQLEEEIESDL